MKLDKTNTILERVEPVLLSKDSFVVPQGVTHIGDHAFQGCFSLTQINLPDSVTQIGDDAFTDCIFLTQITLPESLTQIGVDPFRFSNCLIAINTEDPEHFARIQGLLSQTDRKRLLPIELVSKINQSQQQAIIQVLNQPEASVLYHPQKNESIPKLPADMHALINSYVINDNPYLKKLQREMNQIPFPKNEQELPRYQTDIDSIATAACEAAQESFRPTTSASNNMGIFKPAKKDEQITSASSEEKSDPNQEEEEDDNRPII